MGTCWLWKDWQGCYRNGLRERWPRRLDLKQNPQEVAHCMGLIKTVDCNTDFLDLMEAQTRDEINGGFRPSNSAEDFLRMAREIILMVGKLHLI